MTNLRHILAHRAGCAVLWVAAACSDGADTSPSDVGIDELPPSQTGAVSVAAAELEGREFALESSDGFSAVGGCDVVLYFRNGEVGLNAGCNAQFGRYELREGHVVVPRFASTTKDCDPALQAQDQWLAEFIAKQPIITLVGARVTLHAKSSATLVFVELE